MKKTNIIITSFILLLLVGCSAPQKPIIQQCNTSLIEKQVSDCISQKLTLQSNYDALGTKYTKLQADYEIKNKDIAPKIDANRTYTQKLIRQIRYLENLTNQCHFYNKSQRELNLSIDLEECENKLDEIKGVME